MSIEDGLISVNEVAVMLNRATNHVFRSVRENPEFPVPIQFARGNANRPKFMWRKSDVESFVEKNPKYHVDAAEFKRTKSGKPKERFRVNEHNPFNNELAMEFIMGKHNKKKRIKK